MFQRLWVRIPTSYTGWTIFHIIVAEIVMFVSKDEAESEDGPFFLKNGH